jgi:antitoxin FitA
MGAITASILHVAQLLVRDIETEVVHALKRRAASHGHSAEQEHREILRAALRDLGPKSSLKELLLEMPEGKLDLERPRDYGRRPLEF